jgi:PAS domain-containing protein
VSPAQQPLELILARNLISSLSIPAFLVDDSDTLVFYNVAAGELLAKRFEEIGRRSVGDWGTDHGISDLEGRRLPPEELPLAVAVRESRPVHRRLKIQPDGGEMISIEASSLPLVGADGVRGAVTLFWPAKQG